MDLSHRVYISLSLSLFNFFLFLSNSLCLMDARLHVLTCLALVLSLQFNLIQCYSIYCLSNLQYHKLTVICRCYQSGVIPFNVNEICDIRKQVFRGKDG